MDSKIKSHPSVVRFLDQVCSQIRGRDKKIEVCEEILSHIEADLERADGNSDEAIEKVLEKFGDPHVLGRSLRLAQRTWPQRLITFSVSAAALGFCWIYFSSAYFVGHYRDALDQFNKKVASRMPRFEADQQSLVEVEFLRETSAVQADAGAYLNSRIKWMNDTKVTEIQVPDIPDSAWNSAWLTADIPKSLKNTDLSWIKKLENYDHWDLFAHGPNTRFIGKDAELVNPFSVPSPDLGFLSRAARLHLRRALISGNIVPALKDVRHLARLTYTTETLVGSLMAIALLKMERAAYEEAIKRELLKIADYRAIEPDLLKKMKTTLWATVGFADYSAPDLVKQTFLSNSLWPVGSCAALGETSQHIVLAAEFLKKKYPLEADLDSHLMVIHDLFAKSKPHCRLTFQRQLVDRYHEYTELMMGPKNFSLASGWRGQLDSLRFAYGRYVPYMRQGLGLELLAIARPDFSGLYERE